MADTPEWMRPPAIDTAPVDAQIDRPHPARVYDALLDGKDNFAPDREAAAEALKFNPKNALTPRANRDFLRRAVRWLATEAGIRQFLDIGTGLPTSPNVHEVAQSIAPESRIVYADNDPIVLAHARALLTSHPSGSTSYLDADLRDPAGILAQAKRQLDFSQPVALLLIAVLHFLSDEEDPRGIIRTLLAELPAGSYLVLTHLTAEVAPDVMNGIAAAMNARGIPMVLRDRAQIQTLVDGLDLLDDIQIVHRWNPATDDVVPRAASDADVSIYGLIARKP